jgi:hypothetical protein
MPDMVLFEREWLVYLSIYYNGEKILPENYQQLSIYYNGEPIPTENVEDDPATAEVDETQVSQIDVNLKTKVITIDLQKSEPGLLFVQVSSYTYVGNMSKEITSTKQTIDVTLGVLTYNLFGAIVDTNGSIDPLFDMASCLTVNTNAGVVIPDLVEYVAVGENNDHPNGLAYWRVYVTGLADQTTGDVTINIGTYKTFMTFKIESKDVGTWEFYGTDTQNLPLEIAVKLTNPKITINTDAIEGGAILVYNLTGYDPETKEEVYSADPIAPDNDNKVTVNYGAKIKIKATAAADEEFVVLVDGQTVELDKDGFAIIGYVTKNITIKLSTPPLYTEDLLVTLGQKDQKVVVVFTALDDLQKVDDEPRERTIPALTVDLQLNYSFINEFGDVTAESYEFSVEYKEVLDQGAAFEYSTDDFATKLGDNYQYAFSITGSYVIGGETVKLSKTAYKPVTAAEA